uniref:Small RNA 2'-O-methyltransferase n=1 Tax=Anopheles farauti TaxID=69004 RepID=A0A182QLZ2_9DIPT
MELDAELVHLVVRFIPSSNAHAHHCSGRRTMSGEDFIFSAIADDNMNAFDLNVIASTLASTDKLVRQNKQQKEENDRLREKISSLRESALQIKTLYETELAKASRAEAQLASYVSQCKELEERCLAADSDKINADLILTEQLAEKERQHEEKESRYQTFITDLIRYFSLADDATESIKRRELKHHLPTVDTLGLPDEVKSFLLHAPSHRSRRKKRGSPSVWDRECQTNPVRWCDGSSNTDLPYPVRPDVRHCGTDALTVGDIPSEQQPPPVSKSFCDKGTMHTTSTITRATCTSVFIKRVDVGVNFPEVTHKSVDEILRECVPLPPLLLSPITEIVPLCCSIGTQTDPPVVVVDGIVPEKPATVTCGTITNLKNIRNRIDYRMPTGDGGMAAFQQQYTSVAAQLFSKVKKEDQPAGFGFEADDAFGSMHPHLSAIWKLLGESIFILMSSGRRFDNQCYNMLNEQLTTIRDMIDADGRRESEQMSNMISNVRATVVAAAGYGKDRGTAAAFGVATAPISRSECSASEEDCGVLIVEKDSGENDKQSTTGQTVASQTKEMISDSTERILSAPELISSGMQTVPSETESETILDAQSIETNGTETVPQTGSIEAEQISPPTQPSSNVQDDEVDRIEQQLQMMEEGHIEETGSETPANVLSSTATELTAANADFTLSPEPSASLPAQQSPPREPPRPSLSPTAPGELNRYSTTATFVSPIKVKETNQLVQDQFKTPTQPPIGKRKLRLRRSGESKPSQLLVPPPSLKRLRLSEEEEEESGTSGRTSPTTEFLLEDDWDEKFSTMRAAMLGTRWDDDQCSPLSPIADHIEEDEEEEDAHRMVVGDGEVPEQPSDARERVTTVVVEKEKEQTISPELDAATGIDEEKSEGQQCEIDRIEITKKQDETTPDSAVETSLPVESIEAPMAPIVLEVSLPRERRLSTEPVAVTPEERVTNSPVNTDVPTTKEPNEEDDVQEKEAPLAISESLEDGEITEEDISMLDAPSIELEAIATEPECVDNVESVVWDSPLSPPAHEMGLSITVEQPSTDSDPLPDSPLSPPLPCDRAPMVRSEPPRIPLYHRALHQHLQQQAHDRTEPIFHCIARYSFKRMQETGQKYPNWAASATTEQQPIVQKLTETLSGYLNHPDWTETIVNETLAAILNCTQDVRLISRAVLELVIASGDITFSVLCSPPAPPIPLTQQKLVLIVRHLAYGLATLDEILLHELDRRMFQLKQQGPEPLSLTALIALTFLYIGLEDSKPSECPWKRQYSVRLYMFKCMYYFGFKCLPLVYYVLRAFPYALPKKGSPHYDNADAMIATLRTILMNVNYGETGVGSPEVGLYRKRELLWLLRNTYGYQPGSPTYDELIVNLVEKIRANKLRNVAYALILVAKRNGYEWARLHIIQRRIYPLLNDYLKQFELMRATAACGSGTATSTATTDLDDRIVACIFTIASIMKTQPSHEDASRVMQIFTTIVQLAEGNRAIQEEAIAGLIKFSRFGYVDVFQRLASWCPDYPISDRIRLMLKTMICRKPPRYWRQLIDNRVIDIDDKILLQCRNLVRPLLADYLAPRAKPLTVEVWRGNIAEPHECLEGTDVVIGIEIIEHLHQPVFDKVPENVFGFIQPKVAFFSTPNADYNVLFDGLLANGFRHDDHKFEWTRAQFEAWGATICERFPEYSVKYFGIGPAPAGSEAVGCVSQMAVFVRRDFLDTLPPIASVPRPTMEQSGLGEGQQSGTTSPARPQLAYNEEIGEVVLVQPVASGAGTESAEDGAMASAGGAAVERCFGFADDVVVEERWQEYADVLDELGDNGTSDDDYGEDDVADFGGAGDAMVDMHLPDEEARALRARNDSGNYEEEDPTEPTENDRGEYWLVASDTYPVAAPDDRTHEQRIRDSAEYQLRRLRNFGEDFLAPELDRYLVPLSAVHGCIEAEAASMEELREVLTRAGYQIDAHDNVCLPLEEDDDGDGWHEDRIDDDAEYDIDDRFAPWGSDEEASTSKTVNDMALNDCDETWD